MKNELVCIVCPRGCSMTVENIDGQVTVSGNSCKRGSDFAKKEFECPMRTICSTVATVFPEVPVLPVRVSSDIPKEKIKDVMAEINKVLLKTKIGTGETVIKNVCNTDVDVIATSNILKEIN